MLQGLGLFLLVWVTCWYFKQALVAWLVGPTIQNSLREYVSPAPFSFWSPGDAFLVYVRLSTVPALVTALPLLTRALLLLRGVPALAFIALSYAATALAFVNVRFGHLVPSMLRWLASAGRLSGGLTLRDYVHLVTNLFAGQAVGAQLAVVLLFSTMIRGPGGKSWRWPIVPLLALSGSTLLLGALLTPDDTPLQLRLEFSLPLIALYALATLAGRVIGGSTSARAGH